MTTNDSDAQTYIVLNGKTHAPIKTSDWDYFFNYGDDNYIDLNTTVKIKSADDGMGVDIISSI